ncbi:RNA polymerase sigma factor [Actinomadura citrea]|uniref:RNA polymerase sigma factor n=1 Tax=Actinomadura citrea TaxID=46158 RepID=UPI003CE59C01
MSDHVAGPADEAADNAGAAFEAFQAAWPFWQVELRRYAARRLAEFQVPTGWLDDGDVVQLTWLVLHRNRHRIDRPDRYMYTVARRLIDRARHTAARQESLGEEQLRHPDPARTPERLALDGETAEELAAARRHLSGHQRIVLEYLIEEGLSYREVADELNISVGTVAAHRSRALSWVRLHTAGRITIGDSDIAGRDVYSVNQVRLVRLAPVPLLLLAVLGGSVLVGAVLGGMAGALTGAAIGAAVMVAWAAVWPGGKAVRRRLRRRRHRRNRPGGDAG